MPEFADIWLPFFWRFLHTIFKSVIKHSRITMQKKAITIGNRITALKFVNWSQRGASKKKEPVYWTYCCSIYRLYLGFAIIQTRGRRYSKSILRRCCADFSVRFYVIYTFLLLRGRESIGSHFCSLHNRIPIFLSNTQYAFFDVLHVYLRRRRKSSAPQGIQRRRPAFP